MEIDAQDFREFLALTKVIEARLQVAERRVFALTRMLLQMGAILPPGWDDDSVMVQAMADLDRVKNRRQQLRGSASVIPLTRA